MVIYINTSHSAFFWQLHKIELKISVAKEEGKREMWT
jgi:hypothetical protein